MLREFTSIPCTVLACKIEEGGKVEGSKSKGYVYTHKNKSGITTTLTFQASVKPVEGDYIIQQSKTDVYHCPAEVFAKKYNVKAMVIQ